MATDATTMESEAAIWERVIHPEGNLTPVAARAILKLELPAPDKLRMHELSLRAQQGLLSPAEEREIDNYDRVANLLSILKSKARKLLDHSPGRSQ